MQLNNLLPLLHCCCSSVHHSSSRYSAQLLRLTAALETERRSADLYLLQLPLPPSRIPESPSPPSTPPAGSVRPYLLDASTASSTTTSAATASAAGG
eukprot:3831-Heterococcus_DN1.PRE.1